MIEIVLALLAWQQADAQCRTCETLTSMASTLSDGHSAEFMSYFDKKTPHYAVIEANVSALVAQEDVAASLDILEEKGDDARVEELVDWFLQLTSKDDLATVTRRRMRVRIVAERERNRWKVVSLEPLSIFDPVAVPPLK